MTNEKRNLFKRAGAVVLASVLFLSSSLSIPPQVFANTHNVLLPSRSINFLKTRLNQEAVAAPPVWQRLTSATRDRNQETDALVSALLPAQKIAGNGDHVLQNAPLAEGALTLSDGRSLGYAEYGDPEGIPLLYIPGSQGSRYEPEAYAIGGLAKARIRLIVVERPGIGESTPKPGYQIADWPKDVLEFVNQHLGPMAKFGIFGYSAGGPYALACMADETLKPRIVWRGLYGPLGEINTPAKLSRYNESIQKRYGTAIAWRNGERGDRDLGSFAMSWMRRIQTKWHHAYEMFRNGQSPIDQKILDRSHVSEAIKKSWQWTFRMHGAQGWVDDHAALTAPWPFKLESITEPVHIWYGTQDDQVPFEVLKEIAFGLPKSILHPVAGQAHRGIVDVFPQIIAEIPPPAYHPRERVDNSPKAIAQRILKAEKIDIKDSNGNLKPLDVLRKQFIKTILPAEKLKNFEEIQQAIFRFINGIAVIPLLFALSAPSAKGDPSFLRYLADGPKTLEEISIRFNPEQPSKNMGYKYQLHRDLGNQSWLGLKKKDKEALFSLMPSGHTVLAIAEENAELLQKVSHVVQRSQNYHDYFRSSENLSSELEEYRELIALSRQEKNRWGLSDEGDSERKEATEELRHLLDGMLVCPTIIALGMPVFQLVGNRVEVVDSSFDEKILHEQRQGRMFDLNSLEQDGKYNIPFLRAAFELLASQKPYGNDRPLAEFTGRYFQFLADGDDLISKKGAFGVPTSYEKGSSPDVLKAMLMDPEHPDPIGIRNYAHVLQGINAWGSHLSHVQMLPHVLDMMLQLVGEDGIGISEKASGDGNNVITVSAISVVWLEVLKRYYQASPDGAEKLKAVQMDGPFVVLSSDQDPELLPRQKYIFEELTSMLGHLKDKLLHLTFLADISDPGQYASDVSKAGEEKNIVVTRNGIKLPLTAQNVHHLLMFGIEEREWDPLVLMMSPEEILDIIQERVNRTKRDFPYDAVLRKNLLDVFQDMRHIEVDSEQRDRLDRAINLLSAQSEGVPLPGDDFLSNLIPDLFNISFSNYGELVCATFAAADLILFMEKYEPLAHLGIFVGDVTTTHVGQVDQRTRILGNVNYYFTHAFREKIFTEPQRRLAYILAGYRIGFYRPAPSRDAAMVGLAHLYKPMAQAA